ncbi:hypothetical protein MMC28_010732 [Mycoblastus sanguinarius]|nr:hypothetical protein [Mycoblastus sanguinarius]
MAAVDVVNQVETDNNEYDEEGSLFPQKSMSEKEFQAVMRGPTRLRRRKMVDDTA